MHLLEFEIKTTELTVELKPCSDCVDECLFLFVFKIIDIFLLKK